MTRKDFFERIGFSIPAAITVCSIESCKKSDNPSTGKIDFTIDLKSPEYSKLNTAGGFVLLAKTIDIIIARTINDEYVAVSARCTHQGSLVAYYPSDIFFCSKHGAIFDTKGIVKQGPAVNALQLFKTQLSGTNLRVYS